MELEKLLDGIEIRKIIHGGGKFGEITGISYDSRRVKPGDLFAALRGASSDGGKFIDQALERGAVAVMAEDVSMAAVAPEGVIHIGVDNARDALARISSNFHGNPSGRLVVTGITGTNGKTTVSYLMDAGLRAAGKKTGLIGTIKYVVCGREEPAPFTTPEAPEFQGLLARMLDAGATHVATEISSHALAQKRADFTAFEAAVFTNLTRDHLDYHLGMDGYFAAKKRLFCELLKDTGTAVVNTDDPYGQRLAPGIKANLITYGMNPEADLSASGIFHSADGLSFNINFKGRKHGIKSPLIGMHNVYNILAAFGALAAQGIPEETAIKGIEGVPNVRGRFEKVPSARDFTVVVDYAHTPDALERLIKAAREVTGGRVITVFGCGGNRDRGKRPQMGRIATELSDFTVITSDNPRCEDPAEIINDILKGVRGEDHVTIPGRSEAIKYAIGLARPGDIVLLAGKGHEDYQDVCGKREHFSDFEEAERAIKGK